MKILNLLNFWMIQNPYEYVCCLIAGHNPNIRGAHSGPPQGVPVLNMQPVNWAQAAAAAGGQRAPHPAHAAAAAAAHAGQPGGHPVYTFHAGSGVQMNYLVSASAMKYLYNHSVPCTMTTTS